MLDMDVSDEVLEADSAAVEELAGVLADGPGEDADDDSEGGESEGSELIADDQEVEMALDAAWQATLQSVGLAPDGEGDEVARDREGAAAGAADEGDDSDSDPLLGLGLE